MTVKGEAFRKRVMQEFAHLSAETGHTPTVRELATALGVKSAGHVSYHLNALRKEGRLSHLPHTARGLSVPHNSQAEPFSPAPPSVRVPLSGRIAAGEPIEALVDPDEYIDLPAQMAHGDGVFALRVKGTSMIEDLIDDNDIVVVRPQHTANRGDTIVALLINGPTALGAATLKRYHPEERGIVRLQPANAAVAPIRVREEDLMIQGRVIGVIRGI